MNEKVKGSVFMLQGGLDGLGAPAGDDTKDRKLPPVRKVMVWAEQAETTLAQRPGVKVYKYRVSEGRDYSFEGNPYSVRFGAWSQEIVSVSYGDDRIIALSNPSRSLEQGILVLHVLAYYIDDHDQIKPCLVTYAADNPDGNQHLEFHDAVSQMANVQRLKEMDIISPKDTLPEDVNIVRIARSWLAHIKQGDFSPPAVVPKEPQRTIHDRVKATLTQLDLLAEVGPLQIIRPRMKVLSTANPVLDYLKAGRYIKPIVVASGIPLNDQGLLILSGNIINRHYGREVADVYQLTYDLGGLLRENLGKATIQVDASRPKVDEAWWLFTESQSRSSGFGFGVYQGGQKFPLFIVSRKKPDALAVVKLYYVNLPQGVAKKAFIEA